MMFHCCLLPAQWLALRGLLLAGLLITSACDFSAPVEINLPPYVPVLVLGGFVEAGSRVEVRFAASRPAESAGTSGTPYLGPGVRAVLYDGAGLVLDTLSYASPTAGSIYPRYLSDVVAEAGARYELRAEFAGLPPVRAVADVPRPVAATIRDLGPAADPNGDPLRRITISWTDPPGPTTYAITASRSASDFLPFSSADPDLRDGYEGLGLPVVVNPDGGNTTPGFSVGAYLTDETFAGSDRTVVLLVPAPSQGESAQITLSVISDEMVRYMRALRIQQANIDNPFVEPTDAYSNVEGGLGAFVGYASVSQRL